MYVNMAVEDGEDIHRTQFKKNLSNAIKNFMICIVFNTFLTTYNTDKGFSIRLSTFVFWANLRYYN
jgi:hypothetical protein